MSWSAPGGQTSYEITGGPATVTAAAGATSASITGLTNGQSYTFGIVAIGPGGRSGAATTNAVVPSGAPAAPTGVSAFAVDHDTVSVSWSQQSPSNGTNVSSWQVSISGGGSQTVGTTSATFNGLAASTAYTVTVVAVGENGRTSGAASGSATTPQGPPTQSPAISQSGGGGGTVTFSWPAVPGATHYIVDGVSTTMTSATRSGFMGLEGCEPSDTVSITVAAANAAGTGPSSSASYTFPVRPRDPDTMCP